MFIFSVLLPIPFTLVHREGEVQGLDFDITTKVSIRCVRVVWVFFIRSAGEEERGEEEIFGEYRNKGL